MAGVIYTVKRDNSRSSSNNMGPSRLESRLPPSNSEAFSQRGYSSDDDLIEDTPTYVAVKHALVRLLSLTTPMVLQLNMVLSTRKPNTI